ncbi:Head-to-tail connector protein, podovirus-type [uncultured Caudovirales phage]|uniref:Head-to-tail connector protein, podovirus-type n=1 Tax=uncultured Caudovirales phage TaxID=2100421 RepID=A0A6J5KHZ3_9CAUD|nr:Head-to-tail connector protein, podovirus-type [uncultured Caudovirales phage]
MALTIREASEKRLVGLKAARQHFEPEWREIAQHSQPSRSRFLQSEAQRSYRRSNRAIYNSHGILSFRTLAGGMYSGLSSPSRPWFRLKPYDEALAADQDAKVWLAEVERRIYNFLAGTNFYTSVRTGYAELGMFATSGCVMVDHDEAGAVCHQLTAGEYWVANGSAGETDTLYRRVPMTVAQAVQSFDWAMLSRRVRDCYDRSDYEKIVEVIHAIEPNDMRDPTRLDAKNKPWRSFWWDTQDSDKLNGQLRLSGYDEQPFWAPRWETCGGDAYGTGPGHDSLPDMRELQLHTKRKTEATAFLVKPEKIMPASVKLKGEAGNNVAASLGDAKQVLIPYQMPYQAIEAIMQDMARVTQTIDSLTYADLFMAITNMQGIQPRNIEEIASRNEEKLTQLGPVIERVNVEQLEKVIDRTFGIMSRKGMFPPAPESLQGKPIKVDYVSVLAQMQRMLGIGQLERTVGFIVSAAGANPEALDLLNVDEAVFEYADRAGAPPRMIRSETEVQQIREARQQQAQMQQAAAMAQPAKDGTQALLNVAKLGQGATSPSL